MKEYVVLVDENDRQVGECEKLEAHQKGLLHRAFSVFIFNLDKQLLLQRRADSKYHSGGLWSNTCCGHPRPGESIKEAASRRLSEEMGMKCVLVSFFHQRYHFILDKDMTENEYDHVLLGFSDAQPLLNPEEVSQYRYIDLKDLKDELTRSPDSFTEWFKVLMVTGDFQEKLGILND